MTQSDLSGGFEGEETGETLIWLLRLLRAMLKQEVRDWKDVQIPILAEDQGLDTFSSSTFASVWGRMAVDYPIDCRNLAEEKMLTNALRYQNFNLMQT